MNANYHPRRSAQVDPARLGRPRPLGLPRASIALEHMKLAERTRAAVEARYATGGGRQGDILRAQTDLHRLHADVAGIQESLRYWRLWQLRHGRLPTVERPVALVPEQERRAT
jgi:hypothetical protein